jgi:hypothetical protein
MYNGGSAYVMAIALGYLIGSIPLAYWIGKFSARVDIRDAGEGNVGARNVFHVVGHRWGIIAFIGDFGKAGSSYDLNGDGLVPSKSLNYATKLFTNYDIVFIKNSDHAGVLSHPVLINNIEKWIT